MTDFLTADRKPNFQVGEVILIDKPTDWTSFDVVNFIRSLIKRFYGIGKLKVGHAGTLDPLATGLLILCTGKQTKQIDNYQGMDKIYEGTMQLGITTPTYDLESKPDAHFFVDTITPERIEQVRKQFIGVIEQIPPIYSAIKIDGKRAFDYARKKEDVKLTPRPIRINEFTVDTTNFPELSFYVNCSKGTYIRSLVHDFGKALQNGACMTSLRRTQIGDFLIENAWKIEDLKKLIIDSSKQLET
ncbi:MAG: tRNA pseudouridine(55) synthase TruB [Lentimicrobiaceae bacterium]|jgi:tRNA pseudouridine55 synthase|nr:tRNA pseudouridine(55) synthase TruB [Lentimicrobiaceae bacterium]